MDRTLSHGLKSAMISPGLHERRVCSFDRDQISCKLLHLYERRVCSFDRNQMVQILILRFTLNVRLHLACSDVHKRLNLNLLGILQFTHVQILY